MRLNLILYGLGLLVWSAAAISADNGSESSKLNFPRPVSGSIKATARVERPLGLTDFSAVFHPAAFVNFQYIDPKTASLQLIHFPDKNGLIVWIEADDQARRQYRLGTPETEAGRVFLPGPSENTVMINPAGLNAGTAAEPGRVIITVIDSGI